MQMIPYILFEDIENILQYNLYAYTFNNPVNMVDDEGYWAMTNQEKRTIISAQGEMKKGIVYIPFGFKLKIGASVGKLGTLVKNPGIKINWSLYAKHGTDRMIERGMTKTMVEVYLKMEKYCNRELINGCTYLKKEQLYLVKLAK